LFDSFTSGIAETKAKQSFSRSNKNSHEVAFYLKASLMEIAEPQAKQSS
jgi:hypothetical protein